MISLFYFTKMMMMISIIIFFPSWLLPAIADHRNAKRRSLLGVRREVSSVLFSGSMCTQGLSHIMEDNGMKLILHSMEIQSQRSPSQHLHIIIVIIFDNIQVQLTHISQGSRVV